MTWDVDVGAGHVGASFQRAHNFSTSDGAHAHTVNGIAEARFLSDRQADESMDRFARLADGLTVDGFPVCKGLRYAFFSHCLRSNNYLRCSPKTPRYWVLPTACAYEARPATVL